MVGYVIGLGDRHPGNILIEQTKFNAISIDFGDVFEAAAERSAFPEHVPFRLTPEIFNAFEVGLSLHRPQILSIKLIHTIPHSSRPYMA